MKEMDPERTQDPNRDQPDPAAAHHKGLRARNPHLLQGASHETELKTLR